MFLLEVLTVRVQTHLLSQERTRSLCLWASPGILGVRGLEQDLGENSGFKEVEWGGGHWRWLRD